MKKDKMLLYLGRNIAVVFFVTIVSLLLSIILYYDCSLSEGLQRIFIYNGITFLYFLLLCSLNYCLFEFFKVLMDVYDQLISIIGICCFVVVTGIVYLLPIHSLFHYNFTFMSLLVTLRIVKQFYKKRSHSDLK